MSSNGAVNVAVLIVVRLDEKRLRGRTTALTRGRCRYVIEGVLKTWTEMLSFEWSVDERKLEFTWRISNGTKWRLSMIVQNLRRAEDVGAVEMVVFVTYEFGGFCLQGDSKWTRVAEECTDGDCRRRLRQLTSMILQHWCRR